jgi:hypothetical protein
MVSTFRRSLANFFDSNYAGAKRGRNSAKVAQHGVLGNDVKKDASVLEGRTKHSAFGVARDSAIAEHWSIVPCGTDSPFKNANPVRRGGCWATFVGSLRD